MERRRLAAALGLFAAAIVLGGRAASAGDFVEPAVFASRRGVLDLTMIAKAKPIPSIVFTDRNGAPVNPTGWVYEICERAAATGDACPAGSATVADYGGVRLALQKGDVLKIHFVNRLPKLDPVKVTHSADLGGVESATQSDQSPHPRHDRRATRPDAARLDFWGFHFRVGFQPG